MAWLAMGRKLLVLRARGPESPPNQAKDGPEGNCEEAVEANTAF